MDKLLDGIFAVMYLVFAVCVIVLATIGSIMLLNTDDSAPPNDPEVVEEPSESLQSPCFDVEFEYLANNGDAFEKEVAQSNVNEGDAESNESIRDAGANTASVLTNVRITYYCNCEQCCGPYAGGPTSSGRMPEVGRTVAANKNFIQPGSIVTIFGRDYVVEDTGPACGVIDIFVNDHEEALERGTQITNVEVKRYGW